MIATAPTANAGRRLAKVLVTGATGRIGRVVVADLLRRGYGVRATSSRERQSDESQAGDLEWRRIDFLEESNYEPLVAGCDAVIHLAAELHSSEKMARLNVEVTRLLAEAAERGGVRAFCYASSVAVYGSGRRRIMTEDAPVLTVDRDVRSEYWVVDYVRTYGRTKLEGELALRKAAEAVRYVALRPTVVVDIAELLSIRGWSEVKRTFAAHRHAHHIYVLDVSDAMIWAVERAISGAQPPGTLEVFNLSEDEFGEPTHADFMRKAFAASGDPRFRALGAPPLFDWFQDFAKHRTLPIRNPLWRMRFPNDKLRAAGFKLKFGMAQAHTLALQVLMSESKNTSP